MSIEVKVPVLPDATVAQWHKKVGDSVKRDENLVDLETDKVMLEVPATHDGVLEKILFQEGSSVKSNQIIAVINTEAKGGTQAEPVKEQPTSDQIKEAKPAVEVPATSAKAADALSPSARRAVAEHEVDASQVKGTGKDQRVTKADVKSFAEKQSTLLSKTELLEARLEKRVPMSRLRARVAERLLEVKNNTAMLTTFNEVNMQPVMDLRAQYKDLFEKSHGVKLGFMSFFVKAAIAALKRYPIVNASIDGQDIVYHSYYDIGIAVSTDRGLVVPILRDADQLSMGDIEKGIIDYSNKARDGKLTLEDMTGGTFTITNGGVFGSMLSTPILNAPQSAILGMHNIVKRPIVEKDQIVIRPIMYLALSYDHRLIDGRDSVGFLLTIKQMLEDPARLLLDV